MIINNKKQMPALLKEGYKSTKYFFEILHLLEDGDLKLGIKPDHKEAVKYLLHWANAKECNLGKTIIYYHLEKLYEKDNKKDKAEYYAELHDIEKIKEPNIEQKEKIYYLQRIYTRKLTNSFINKNKISNQKEFTSAMNYFFEYLLLVNPKDIIFAKPNIIESLKEIFGSKKYGYERLYLAHYLSGRRDNKILLDFTESDYVEYIKLLKKLNLTIDYDLSLLSYLEITLDYKYLKKDDESLCKYALFKCINKRIFTAEPQYFTKIEECYTNGYKEALLYICDFYIETRNEKSLLKYIATHQKKYPKDHKTLVTVADKIIKYFVKEDGTIFSSSFIEGVNKAIQIYEKFSNKLNDEQLQFLSSIYLKGIIVKKDIDKARLYSKNKDSEIFNDSEIEELILNNKSLDKDSKDKLNSFIKNSSKEYIDDITQIIFDTLLATHSKENNKLLYLIAKKYENEDIRFKFFLALCYGYEYGIDVDTQKYQDLLDECMKNNLEYAYDEYINNLKQKMYETKDVDKYFPILNKLHEEGHIEATIAIAQSYEDGTVLKKDVSKTKDLYESLVKQNIYKAKYLLAHLYYKYGDEEILKEAYELVKDALKTKESSELYNCLYLIYDKNKTRFVSDEEAFNALLKIEKTNDPGLHNYRLFKHYYKGIGTKQDYKKARKHLFISFDHNNHDAIFEVASSLIFKNEELNIQKDYEKGYELLTNLKKQNSSIDVEPLLSIVYLRSKKYKNYEKAYKWFLDSYENKGKKYVSFYLGIMYARGYYVEQNDDKALQFFEEAKPILGSTVYFELGYLYLYHMKNDENRYKKAVEYFLESYKAFKSTTDLGLIAISYYLDKSYKNAAEYAQKALSIKPLESCYAVMASLYYNGYHFEKDLNKAISFYEKGVELGDVNAAYCLCEYYGNHDVNNKCYDEEKFLKYLPIVLKRGRKEDLQLKADYLIHMKEKYIEGYQFILENIDLLKDSEIYADVLNCGYGTKKDHKKAFEIYSKLNKDQNVSVKFKLGRMYFFGEGVEQDKEKAKELIYKAKEKNYSDAIKFYNEFFKD